jgi:5'-nucleotidase
MNALGLDASAVGNHEFDRGWPDLRDRVIGAAGSHNAKWDYLGANIYAKGTTDPVLPEYALFDLDGISVAVVGAVTEETGTLVSPGGITQIDFGNPIEAVNRVAGRLSDGNTSNGEAQVIVASFHAGAQQGVGSNYEAEVAKGGEFAQMANLDPAVDVIFNGHTHQTYAWDAPIPGGGGTRPIIQTGQYADNVGQVTLSVDPATGDVVTYSVRNVARLTTPDAELVTTYPRVAQVKTIVDAALAQAAVVGNQPVGSLTADITRAFSNGSYVNGRWVSPMPRTEDRGSESALGDLVGNALRDGIPTDMGEADLGIVNPGGLRADLFYAGNTAQNPANTDGVITYSEANGVLPFVNNIWLIDLTGAQLKAVLEQQWQTNPGGPTPARPFLALGLSDNVKTTLDATKPEGSRVTSVTIDGVALDPAATYTVSTFSFLGTGGDNFRAFRDGVARDTGLVDRDLWISYLQSHAMVAPDFARERVDESGLPSVVYAGQQVGFDLKKLNLTSLGSPENTSLRMVASDDTTTVVLGTLPVTSGTANVAFAVPAAFVGGGYVELMAQPSQTVVRIPIGVRGSATVDGSAEPIAYGGPGAVLATVSPASATGTVSLYRADLLLGSGTVVAGSAEIALPPRRLEPGNYRLRLEYSGDLTHSPAVGHVDVEVTKAVAVVSATATPTTLKVKKDTTIVAVNVSAEGVIPTGTVAAYVQGSVVASAELVAGSANLTVGPFASVGASDIEVRYLGDGHVATGSDSVTVSVVKNRPRVTVVRTPAVVKRSATRAVFTVTVTAPGLVATGTVQIKVDGALFATKTLANGTTSIRLNPLGQLGSHEIKLVYSGDASLERVAESRALEVVQ